MAGSSVASADWRDIPNWPDIGCFVSFVLVHVFHLELPQKLGYFYIIYFLGGIFL